MKTIVVLLALLAPFAAFADITAPPVDLEGEVVDAGGRAIPGARVVIYEAWPKVGVSSLCPSCYRDCGKEKAAGADGTFRIKALDSTLVFRILAVASGYEPLFVNKVDPSKGPVKLTLRPRDLSDANQLVRGCVYDPSGKPVIGATVHFHALRDKRGGVGYGAIPGVEKVSVTDDRGEFALRLEHEGAKIDVRVRARNFAPQFERLLVPGDSRSITLSAGAVVEGRLMQGDQPVAGAVIGLAQPPGPSENYLFVVEEIATNEDGRFVLTSIAPGIEYWLYPHRGPVSFAPRAVCVTSDVETINVGTIQTGSSRRISGHVVVAGGGALPRGTRVTVFPPYSRAWTTVEVGDDGRFSIDGVSRERLLINAEAPKRRLSRETAGYNVAAEKVNVYEGGDVEDLVLVIE